MRRVATATICCCVVLGAFVSTRASGAELGGCADQQLSCEQLVELGLTYPYSREPTSYLFVEGVAYPYVNLRHRSLADALVRAGDDAISARVLLERLGLGGQLDAARAPVLAYGSNANVDALTRKFVTSGFAGPAVVPVVKATLHDFDVTWAPQLVFNGAMPATIVPSPGTAVSVWITWLDAPELDQMNATEGVGTLYSYGNLGKPRLDTAVTPTSPPGLYVSCAGALRVRGDILAIAGVPARHRRFLAVDATGAMKKVATALGWRGSAFDVVLDNVRSPDLAAARSQALGRLSTTPRDPGYTIVDACNER